MTCIPAIAGDNAAALQAELNAGHDLRLCPSETYEIRSALQYRVPDQRIFTDGNPMLEASQARLEWGSSDPGSEMIIGSNLDDLQLHHVAIDGMRSVHGYGPSSPGMASGATVDFVASPNVYVAYNYIRDPRGWSCLHVFPGGFCAGTTIEHNTLGPAGQPDGTWADGISYACYDGEVAFNTITDATDGAIVIFGGSGSLIHDNTIVALTRRLLGGINMVDPAGLDLSYEGTEVFSNEIRSDGARIKLAMGMGPMPWGFFCGGAPHFNSGASVHDNHLEGSNFGYGYVLNGVDNWQFFNNTANGSFYGTPIACGPNVAAPRAFACQQETVNGGVCPAGTDVITLPEHLNWLINPATQD